MSVINKIKINADTPHDIGVDWSNVANRPAKMPASDVYPWAKASSKPSYSWDEINSKPDTFIPATHPHGNITNAGAIGTAANKLISTTTNGVLTAATTLAASSLAAGSTPTVSLSGGTLTFGIPKGDKGDTGAKGATGATGLQGPKGDTGLQGPQGNPGPQGVSISKVEQTATSTADSGTNTITVTLSDGTKSTFNVKNGSKGSKGDTGDAAGFGTPTASIDANVGTPSVTVTASGANTAKVFNFAFKNLKGATGSQGPQGPKGDKGNTGSQGPQGPQGPKGDKGDTGPTFTVGTSSNKLYLLGTTAQNSNITNAKTYNAYMQNGGVYCAVWNDLSDSIPINEDCKLEHGYCYCFNGEEYHKSSKYLDNGIIGIHSDTFGLKLGTEDNKKKLDVAVAGFALAYVDKEYSPGTPLTCTENGYLTEIKKQDKIEYPEKIVATYWKNEPAEEWGTEDKKVKVNGRKWVKIK